MREILYRGKRKDNGEWIYGYYCPTPFSRFPCKPSIYFVDDINSNWHGIEVIPETVGQYTGLQDKNGTKIFEGDIIKFFYLNPIDAFDRTNYGEVMYSDENAAFTVEGDYLLGELLELEVVGNIYDKTEI